MNKFFKISSVIGLVSIMSTGHAWLYYQNNVTPRKLLQQANPYTTNNPYDSQNFNSPYNTLKNPYEPASIYNDPKFAAPIYNQQEQFRGRATQLINKQVSVTNPYRTYGSAYDKNSFNPPYGANSSGNPYTVLQNPYDPRSFRNDPRFGQQYYDSKGNYLGSSLGNTYNNDLSITNLPEHSHFETYFTKNPYGNKVKQ